VFEQSESEKKEIGRNYGEKLLLKNEENQLG
jgi:hypothetical protein